MEDASTDVEEMPWDSRKFPGLDLSETAHLLREDDWWKLRGAPLRENPVHRTRRDRSAATPLHRKESRRERVPVRRPNWRPKACRSARERDFRDVGKSVAPVSLRLPRASLCGLDSSGGGST